MTTTSQNAADREQILHDLDWALSCLQTRETTSTLTFTATYRPGNPGVLTGHVATAWQIKVRDGQDPCAHGRQLFDNEEDPPDDENL